MPKTKTLKRYVAYNARVGDEDYTKIVEPALNAGYSKADLVIEGAKSFMEVNHKVKHKQD